MKQKAPGLLQLRIVAIAIHFSILLYIFIIFFLAKSHNWSQNAWGEMILPEHRALFYILLGVSGIFAVMVVMVPQLFRGKNSEHSAPPNIFFNFGKFSLKIFNLTVLRLALAETIAIFGFVLAFLNQAPWVLIPFATVSLGLQILFGPWVQGTSEPNL